MTMVYRETDPSHACRQKHDDVIVVLNTTTNRVLHYERSATSGGNMDVPVV